MGTPELTPVDAPRISVVVATRNRCERLRRLLEALSRQSLPREAFEVIVVDDASSDATTAVLSGAGERVRVIRQSVRSGPAAARNAGWRMARGAIIAFTDDDCRPDVRWLEAGDGAMGEGLAVVMGRTVPEPAEADGLGPFARTMSVDHEDGRYPTCNVFYRREALERVGGFDEIFRRACGEDTDLAWRVKSAGFASAYCGDAVVYHAVRPPSFATFLRERRRFADQILLVRRHPHLRSLFYRRWFYRRSHVHALFTVATVALALATTPAWLGVLPFVWAERLRRSRIGQVAPLRRPGLVCRIVVGDLWELLVFAWGSVYYRTLLL